MKIERVIVGRLLCNCYLLSYGEKVLIIDPGDNYEMIVEKIGKKEVVGVIVTHRHFDHIEALSMIVDKYKVKVYDRSNLVNGWNVIDVFKFIVIYTPGHKEDAITIYFKDDKVMFCGDFIFRDSIGRWDLEGGNIQEMCRSILEIKKYDRDIIIYPGHGDKTTLGYEMDNNIYFRDDVKYF